MSAMEMQTREIDGHEYQFARWGAKKSTKILIRLSRILGEPLSLAITSIKGDKQTRGKSVLDRDFDMDIIGKAVRSLFERMSDENEVLDLIENLTSGDNVFSDGKKVIFDLHYQDRLGHMAKVLYAALEVQYGNFFGDVIGQFGQFRAAPGASTPENQT